MNFYTQICRICGCTNDDCRQCIQKIGTPCYWLKEDLCSTCAVHLSVRCEFLDRKGYDQVATFETTLPVDLDESHIYLVLKIICMRELAAKAFFGIMIKTITHEKIEGNNSSLAPAPLP